MFLEMGRRGVACLMKGGLHLMESGIPMRWRMVRVGHKVVGPARGNSGMVQSLVEIGEEERVLGGVHGLFSLPKSRECGLCLG
jgi:hypothetical protein